jgi:hypothetical protein
MEQRRRSEMFGGARRRAASHARRRPRSVAHRRLQPLRHLHEGKGPTARFPLVADRCHELRCRASHGAAVGVRSSPYPKRSRFRVSAQIRQRVFRRPADRYRRLPRRRIGSRGSVGPPGARFRTAVDAEFRASAEDSTILVDGMREVIDARRSLAQKFGDLGATEAQLRVIEDRRVGLKFRREPHDAAPSPASPTTIMSSAHR